MNKPSQKCEGFKKFLKGAGELFSKSSPASFLFVFIPCVADGEFYRKRDGEGDCILHLAAEDHGGFFGAVACRFNDELDERAKEEDFDDE